MTVREDSGMGSVSDTPKIYSEIGLLFMKSFAYEWVDPEA